MASGRDGKPTGAMAIPGRPMSKSQSVLPPDDDLDFHVGSFRSDPKGFTSEIASTPPDAFGSLLDSVEKEGDEITSLRAEQHSPFPVPKINRNLSFQGGVKKPPSDNLSASSGPAFGSGKR